MAARNVGNKIVGRQGDGFLGKRQPLFVIAGSEEFKKLTSRPEKKPTMQQPAEPGWTDYDPATGELLGDEIPF